MKKFFLVLVAVLCVASVSAQKTKWAAGLRATYGVQAVGEYFYSSDKYAEARFGLYGGACAVLTALHNWKCCNWDWTPKVGKWYLDAGVGVNLGGAAHYVWGGVAGDVKFGIKFNKVPIRLAVDVSPSTGIVRNYAHKEEYTTTNDAGEEVTVSKTTPGSWGFNPLGLASVAISATWCF